jgi:hypothetical protein
MGASSERAIALAGLHARNGSAVLSAPKKNQPGEKFTRLIGELLIASSPRKTGRWRPLINEARTWTSSGRGKCKS